MILGITAKNVTLDELLAIREELIQLIRNSLTAKEKEFLVSVKEGDPKYDLMSFKDLEKLPAMQWKLINVKRMDKNKHKIMLDKLKKMLE